MALQVWDPDSWCTKGPLKHSERFSDLERCPACGLLNPSFDKAATSSDRSQAALSSLPPPPPPPRLPATPGAIATYTNGSPVYRNAVKKDGGFGKRGAPTRHSGSAALGSSSSPFGKRQMHQAAVNPQLPSKQYTFAFSACSIWVSYNQSNRKVYGKPDEIASWIDCISEQTYTSEGLPFRDLVFKRQFGQDDDPRQLSFTTNVVFCTHVGAGNTPMAIGRAALQAETLESLVMPLKLSGKTNNYKIRIVIERDPRMSAERPASTPASEPLPSIEQSDHALNDQSVFLDQQAPAQAYTGTFDAAFAPRSAPTDEQFVRLSALDLAPPPAYEPPQRPQFYYPPGFEPGGAEWEQARRMNELELRIIALDAEREARDAQERQRERQLEIDQEVKSMRLRSSPPPALIAPPPTKYHTPATAEADRLLHSHLKESHHTGRSASAEIPDDVIEASVRELLQRQKEQEQEQQRSPKKLHSQCDRPGPATPRAPTYSPLTPPGPSQTPDVQPSPTTQQRGRSKRRKQGNNQGKKQPQKQPQKQPKKQPSQQRREGLRSKRGASAQKE